jgi:DegV family protein with EDD domain
MGSAMSSISIITDSVACLPHEFLDRYHIEIIPITLLSGGNVYKDGIDLTPDQAYELFAKEPESFKTAPASPEECLAIFRKVAQKSEEILCITLSAKISTLFNVVNIAREKVKIEKPDVRLEVMDSETAAAAQGLVVLAASREIEKGKSIGEVLEVAQRIKSRVHAVVLLDTVRFVYRSGRVPKIAAQAAAYLNIRPIFSLYSSVNFITAVRSKKSGIERILELMRQKVGNKPVHCAVMHAYDLEEAKKLKTIVESEFNCLELWISEFSPVMGYATGTGTLGLAFYTES